MAAFKLWLEHDNDKPLVFLDFDETLVHSIHEKKHGICISLPNKKHTTIHDEDNNLLPTFARPHLTQFIQTISKFAHIYILTRNQRKHVKKILKKLKIYKYFSGIYSTRDDINPYYDLKLNNKKWVLIDNMPLETIETANKIALLMGSENIERAQKNTNHFIPIKTWLATIDDNHDKELLNIIPDIKKKLDI